MKKNKHELPPALYLLQVLKDCPKAALTYCMLWSKKDVKNCLTIYRNDIRSEFLMTQKKFNHDLLLLVREALINVQEEKDYLVIEVVGWDFDNGPGLALC